MGLVNMHKTPKVHQRHAVSNNSLLQNPKFSVTHLFVHLHWHVFPSWPYWWCIKAALHNISGIFLVLRLPPTAAKSNSLLQTQVAPLTDGSTCCFFHAKLTVGANFGLFCFVIKSCRVVWQYQIKTAPRFSEKHQRHFSHRNAHHLTNTEVTLR